MSTVAPFVAVSTTVRPNRRPPRPKHPKFTHFHRSGLHFGRIHPQHRQYGDSSKAYGDCRSVRGRRQGLAEHRKRLTERSSRRGRRAGGPIRINHHNPTGVEGAGGTGGPGRASRRGAERSEVAQPRGRPDPPAPGTPAGPSCASCGRRQGLARQRDDAPNQTSTTCPTGMEGTGGTGGPSCGARGRRQGLARQRDDAPSEARGADGERAGRSASITTTPPVWRVPEGPEGQGGLRGAAPNEVRSPSLAGGRARRRPEHPWGHKQPNPAPT